MLVNLKSVLLFLIVLCTTCNNQTNRTQDSALHAANDTKEDQAPLGIAVGAEQKDQYVPLLKGKRVGLLVNQTSMVGQLHLVDYLLQLEIDIQIVFAPEHGFRGKADAGQHLGNEIDRKTGIPLISLYGKKKKPTKEDLSGIDILIFDIQDVGARFYTYISSLHYIMEACADHDKLLLILDRPNPNGHYVDGPVLDKAFSSFVGMHPVPVVHGMTVAEYARMIQGEGWLGGNRQCNLRWVLCKNYTHNSVYELPVKPSPNLPNMRSIYLYPSLCFFEGTHVSVGRGTNTQFQVYGHPDYPGGDYSFTPVSMEGATYPKHENTLCYGHQLSHLDAHLIRKEKKLRLSYLINFYNSFPNKEQFFVKNRFFDKLAGSDILRKQIEKGMTEDEIRNSWKPGLDQFISIREKYLLYPL